MKTSKIPHWLENTTLEDLFFHGQAKKVLRQRHAEARLALVVASSDVKPNLRILAHELLLRAGHKANPAMVEVYCQTIPNTFLHNWWGMPGQYTEHLGQTLLSYNEAALPCLSHLLDDTQPLSYFGSEETTLDERMHYRVCDLAAYFIARITNVDYPDSDELSTRDEFIRALKFDQLPKLIAKRNAFENR